MYLLINCGRTTYLDLALNYCVAIASPHKPLVRLKETRLRLSRSSRPRQSQSGVTPHFMSSYRWIMQLIDIAMLNRFIGFGG